MLKSEVSIQEAPFHSSVIALLGFPPTAKAAVYVPSPAKPPLAVLRLLTSVQVEPFQSSVFAVAEGACPPNFTALEVVPVAATS